MIKVETLKVIKRKQLYQNAYLDLMEIMFNYGKSVGL